MRYQSNFFDSSNRSHRVDCAKRLKVLRQYALGGQSLLDLGCNGGYYTFGLGGLYSSALGVDSDGELIQECKRLKQKHQVDNVSFVNARISDILEELESKRWSTVLYMSVHHHLIAQIGYDKASKLFYRLSGTCEQMFFDMGQKNEACVTYDWWKRLPKVDDQEQWLKDYISANTTFSKIDSIGSSPVHGVERLLWKLEI